jgi:hypothetical protein
MPRSTRPDYFERLDAADAYARLEFYAKHFARGHYNCLVICGPPGRLKSSIIERAVQGAAFTISGNNTPFDVFTDLRRHLNELIVIDDADGLYGEPAGLRLLKGLTNPKKPATVHWGSRAVASDRQEIRTDSKVCIIDNAWGRASEHVIALEDRSRLFLFDPPPLAVHRQMANEEWFTDTEIYDFIGDHLFFIKEAKGKGLSVRVYVKALEAKEAGEDWREYVLRQYVKGPDLDLLVIEADPYFRGASVEKKCQAWMTRTGKARSTYFDHKRQLLGRLAAAGADCPLLGRWSLEPGPGSGGEQ